MKVFLIAAVAVAVSGAAYAKDLKGSVMSDAEMDKVTAGAGNSANAGLGAFDTAFFGGNAALNLERHAFDALNSAALRANSPNGPGNGTCTAGHPPC